MELVIVLIVLVIILIIGAFIFEVNLKKLKEAGNNKKCDDIVSKFPNNKEICEDILEKLNNKKVKIKENNDKTASLYIAISDTIFIANISKTYTRIQTIAHECLHSIQDKKLLMFNFIFSNIYLLYFTIVCILGILKILPYKMMFLVILLILSAVYYLVRIFLENDAMIKARFLAKEYMEDVKISSKEEIEKIVNGFDKINNVGIKCINYKFFLDIMIKVLILDIIFLIR